MSSKTSSRSTLTTVPSTMSPSLKYLMVSSIAARKASSDPMSLTATCGVLEVASVLLVMCGMAPDTDMRSCLCCAEGQLSPLPMNRRCDQTDVDLTEREPALSEARAGPQRSDQNMGGQGRRSISIRSVRACPVLEPRGKVDHLNLREGDRGRIPI